MYRLCCLTLILFVGVCVAFQGVRLSTLNSREIANSANVLHPQYLRPLSKLSAETDDVAIGSSEPEPESEPEEAPVAKKFCQNRGKKDLFALAAATKRGACETQAQKGQIYELIEKLERINPTPEPAYSEKLNGEWLLCYSSDDATRSSPFFWSFRKLLKPFNMPFDETQQVSEAIFSITDSIPIKTVGQAKQTISGYGADTNGTLISEVEVIAGSERKGVFPSFKSKMTTTSRLEPYSDKVTQITVEKTQVLDSDLDRVLPVKISSFSFPTERVFSALKDETVTQVRMKTTYLDDTMRITRNRFGHVFVYARDFTNLNE